MDKNRNGHRAGRRATRGSFIRDPAVEQALDHLGADWVGKHRDSPRFHCCRVNSAPCATAPGRQRKVTLRSVLGTQGHSSDPHVGSAAVNHGCLHPGGQCGEGQTCAARGLALMVTAGHLPYLARRTPYRSGQVACSVSGGPGRLRAEHSRVAAASRRCCGTTGRRVAGSAVGVARRCVHHHADDIAGIIGGAIPAKVIQ